MKQTVNEEGIYSFFTVLGASVILLALHAAILQTHAIHAQTELGLLYNEHVSFHRTLLEQELDERLQRTLDLAVFVQSNPPLIQQAINRELETIVTEYSNHSTIRFQKKEDLSNYLMDNSNVIVVDVDVPLVYAEYTLLAPVTATITIGNASAHFSLPAGYTLSTTVIR
jgi:hypothetical protein